MPSVTIQLETSVEFHNKPVSEITLREPTGGMFLDLGDPRLLARMADGTVFWVEDKPAIKGYLDRCVENDGGAHVVRLLSIGDMKRVKDALFRFFDGAAKTSDG